MNVIDFYVKLIWSMAISVLNVQIKNKYNNELDWTPIKYLNVWHYTKVVAKILPTSHCGYFGHVWSLPSIRIIPTCTNFDVYLHKKNELHSELIF